MKRAVLLLTSVAGLVVAPVAAAHVTANPSSGEAGSYAMIAFRVPHGCEESPTTSLTIRIPAGIVSVAPQAVPGWRVTTKEGKLPEPVEAEGETITEGVRQVTWTGGPLGAHQFTDFGISMRLPDTPGDTVYFPAVQRCQQGMTRWIQIPVDGEPEPDEPAPGVELTAGSGGHGGSDDAMASEEATTTAASESGPEDEDDMDGADMAALGMGAGGLVAGLAGLVVALRRRPRA